MKSVLPPIEIPELIVALVARMGVDVRGVANCVEHEFLRFGYKSKQIRITELLRRHNLGEGLKETPIDARIDSYITACNNARIDAGVNELFALLALLEVRSFRKQKTNDPRTPHKKKTVFILDQFKRPEEVALLREVYGDRFIQISCHAPEFIRTQNIAEQVIGGHPENLDERHWEGIARKLIERDESEKSIVGGQSVREVFPEADLVIDASSEKSVRDSIERFLKLLFNAPSISPTFMEYGNNIAFQASYRSLDLSRQVGASIFDERRRVLALGANEVPKAGGGTYWEGDTGEYRDVRVGHDINAIRKRGLVIDVVKRLRDAGKLSDECKDLPDEELERVFVGEKGAPLRKAEILDILEYGRAVHAEMNAISDAARGEVSLQGATLFCTTFPCHNCAKHIVAAGIANVVFLQPYPKSNVLELYPDSVAVDPISPFKDKVSFTQFVGVTSRRFHLFAHSKRKNDSGHVSEWDPQKSAPNIKATTINYFDDEDRAISDISNRLKGRAKELLG